MQIQVFSVSGISCERCVAKIEFVFDKEIGFESVQVSRNPDRLQLGTREGITKDEVNRFLKTHELDRYAVEDLQHKTSEKGQGLIYQLFPLVLVISYILLGVLTIAWARSDFSIMTMMSHYMAGFFLVFSFFKFLNIQGFVDAFQTYDPVARLWRPYGYFYAAFELSAGIGYLLFPGSLLLNIGVVVLLSISSWGVIRAVTSGNRIQCACLGTVFNLPMTKVTIAENVLMIGMAGATIFFI